MDPCPVIREPLSGARDRTTLGQTSAPIIVLTVQLYTWKWTVHATACTLRVLKIPQNFSNHPFLFSSRNYALTISSIKFPKFKIFVVGMVKIGMVRWRIIKSYEREELWRTSRGWKTFLLLLGGLEERHVRRYIRFETPCAAAYTRVLTWKRESMRMHMYTVRLLLDFDA